MCRVLLLVKIFIPLAYSLPATRLCRRRAQGPFPRLRRRRALTALPHPPGIRPLDDAPPSQVLDVLVVVPDLPQEGLGVLADLGGGR